MRKAVIFFAVIFIFLISGLTWWGIQTRPLDPDNSSSKIFVIEKGATVREIGNKLKEEELIKDPVAFFVYIKKEGLDRKIQAGTYRLSPSMNIPTLVDSLQVGTIDIWVTFPEGVRAEEIADILEENVPTYTDAWRARLNEEEGYLFPDTYLIPKDADVETVISVLKNTFNNKITELGLTSESPELVNAVIMASLIEREAITDEEKPIIAGILTNRLNAGMALQVDASIQYAKGYNSRTKKWWSPVTLEEYKSVDSSYNTYLSPGLPPGPIANPGIEAIRAALNPADTDYVYYIHDLEGNIHYARTLAEHEDNVEKYLR